MGNLLGLTEQLLAALMTDENTISTNLIYHWDFPQPFILPLTVCSADIDGLQHTNNAVYVQWCQQAAWAHSAELGLREADYQALDRAMAIRHSEYDYIFASSEGEELLLATWLTKSQGLSMERCFQLSRKRDGETILRGKWRLVCIEISTGKPKRQPPIFVEAYGPAVVAAD